MPIITVKQANELIEQQAQVLWEKIEKKINTDLRNDIHHKTLQKVISNNHLSQEDIKKAQVSFDKNFPSYFEGYINYEKQRFQTLLERKKSLLNNILEEVEKIDPSFLTERLLHALIQVPISDDNLASLRRSIVLLKENNLLNQSVLLTLGENGKFSLNIEAGLSSLSKAQQLSARTVDLILEHSEYAFDFGALLAKLSETIGGEQFSQGDLRILAMNSEEAYDTLTEIANAYASSIQRCFSEYDNQKINESTLDDELESIYDLMDHEFKEALVCLSSKPFSYAFSSLTMFSAHNSSSQPATAVKGFEPDRPRKFSSQ